MTPSLPSADSETRFLAMVRSRTGLISWCCWVIVAAALANHAWVTAGILRSDVVNVDGIEPNVVYTVQQVLLGRPIYSSVDSFPWAVTQYSPAYYYLCGGVCGISGISPDDPRAVTTVCRIVSTLLGISTACVTIVLVRRLGGTWASSAAAACAAILVPSTWGLLARPDALQSFLLFTALLLIVRLLDHPSILTLVATGIISTLPVLAKQNGVFLAVGVTCWLLARRVWGKAGLVLVGQCVGFLLIASVVIGVYGNEARVHLIDSVRQGMEVRHGLYNVYVPTLASWGALLAVGSLVTVAVPPASSAVSLVRSIAFMVLLLSSLSALKLGSNTNYMSDPLIVVSICIASSSVWRAPMHLPLVIAIAIAAPVAVLSAQGALRGSLSREDNRFTDAGLTLPLAYLRGQMQEDDLLWSNDRRFTLYFPRHAILPQPDLTRFALKDGWASFRDLETATTARTTFIVINDRREARTVPWLAARVAPARVTFGSLEVSRATQVEIDRSGISDTSPTTRSTRR